MNNEYLIKMADYIKLEKENEALKQKLNWIAFGDEPELALRYLRKIGYVGFDEKRKVYINRHNNEPFLLKDEVEKDYYISDEELNEYTEQLEKKCDYKTLQINNKNKWFQLIADIGYDYDGCNKVESLKGLIDELVQYALFGRDDDSYEEWINKGENNE